MNNSNFRETITAIVTFIIVSLIVKNGDDNKWKGGKNNNNIFYTMYCVVRNNIPMTGELQFSGRVSCRFGVKTEQSDTTFSIFFCGIVT